MATKRVIYSDLEKQVFLEILKKYKHIIESKRTNSLTLKEKSEAWFIITQEYNESSLISNKKNVSQLKKYWSNLKQQNKNILTAERQARFLTGGSPQKNVGEVDSNVLDIKPSLMTTAPTISSSNFTKNESIEIDKKNFKAVKQNNLTVLNEVSNEQHLKKTPIKTPTLSCSQHEICQLRKEREEFINEWTVRKLLLKEKELKERVKLAKFQAQKKILWSHAHKKIPTFLVPEDCGWVILNSKYQFRWFDGPQTPSSVKNVVIDQEQSEADINEIESEDDIDCESEEDMQYDESDANSEIE
ncbi:uncharacterized protein LOC143905418 [Temnothorax americanus]|uniref:uncharacterized protein LOC143905418 n=1 Tax=Temnothorax americanus TaxID=1964332 RepID=UPI004067AC74